MSLLATFNINNSICVITSASKVGSFFPPSEGVCVVAQKRKYQLGEKGLWRTLCFKSKKGNRKLKKASQSFSFFSMLYIRDRLQELHSSKAKPLQQWHVNPMKISDYIHCYYQRKKVIEMSTIGMLKLLCVNGKIILPAITLCTFQFSGKL